MAHLWIMEKHEQGRTTGLEFISKAFDLGNVGIHCDRSLFMFAQKCKSVQQ